MKTITKNIITLIITLGVFSSPFFAHAATWVGPTATPPGNNVSAPVNVGGTYQIKAGDLGVISLFANYIKSLGTISAKRYCFNVDVQPAGTKDTNCITSWPTGGTGGGIESIVAGTNVTVDNTDPLNPIVSSTATGGTSGVIVRKDGVPVVAPATTLNFTGSNITTTPSGSSVSIAVTPATPTAIRKDGVQVSAAPLALDFTGSNITAQNVGGVVKINVAPTNPTAIQKDGIQVSAAPLAVNFVGDNITATNNGGIVSVDVKKLTVKQDDNTVGTNFTGINFVGGSDWVVTNGGGGIARIENVANPVTQLALPSASPADRTLRSDGTNWVQSTTVTNTTSGLFVRAINNPPVTLATPQSSFNNTEDIFQAINSANPLYGRGLGVRKDGTVRVQGLVTTITTPLPISTGLFLNSNDVFHVIGTFPDRGNPPVTRGFGLDVTGTTRVEGVLAVNGAQFLDGNFQHYGDKFQTGDTNQIGNYNLTGDLTHNGNGTHVGDNYFIGNLNVDGGTELVGTVDIAGNVVHTGNINTNGRWAMNDNVPVGTVFLSGGGFQPVPYSFIAQVNGGSSSLGIRRDGSSVIQGSLAVFGPSTFTGNLDITGSIAVSGTAKVGNLVNTTPPSAQRPVCVTNNGTLQLCVLPSPTVEITSSGLTNNSFTSAPLVNTTGAITASQNTNISYTVTNATSCSLTVQQGSAPSWISSHTVPNLFSNDYVKNTTINSTGPTVLKVTCSGGGGTASDTITIQGHGSWKATSPGVYQLSFSNFTYASAQIWGGGAGGGGGFVYNTNNGYWCSAGGGGGAGQHSIYNGFTSGTISVGSGGSGGAGASTTASGAMNGSSGGDTTISSGGVNLATADGGYGGIGGYSQQVYGQLSAPGAQYGTNTPSGSGVGQFNDSGFWGGLSSCFALGGSGKAPTSAGILTGAYATGGSGGYGSSAGSPQYTSGGSGGSGYAQLSW